MQRIPEARKQAILARISGPDREPMKVVATEEGVSEATLDHWRRQARLESDAPPGEEDAAEGWSSRDKFQAVLETASLHGSELAEYCRQRGLAPESIDRWRAACARANNPENTRRREQRERMRELAGELRRKEQALAEAEARLKRQKPQLGGRGRLTSVAARRELLSAVDTAIAAGATQTRCVEVLGLSDRTLQRWRLHPEDAPDGRTTAVHIPPNTLSEEKRAEVLRLCNLPENASKPLSQIVAELADEGIYLASESTFYRILRRAGQPRQRSRARAPRSSPPPSSGGASDPPEGGSGDSP